eukprot:jgi/Bigna1/80799/fgenesh1_pg.74_\
MSTNRALPPPSPLKHQDLGHVTVSITATTTIFVAVPLFARFVPTWGLSTDAVPWPVEKAILTMKKAEESLVTINGSSLVDSGGKRMFPQVSNSTLCEFHVTCENFTKVLEPFELENATDKVDAALERKNVGNTFFLKGNLQLANRLYSLARSSLMAVGIRTCLKLESTIGGRAAYELLKDIDFKDTKDPAFEVANTTRLSVILNLAAVRNKLRKISEVVPILSPILSTFPKHAKALYRRAEAYYGLKMYREAIADSNKAFGLSPSEQIADLHDRAVKAQKSMFQKEKQVWSSAMNKVMGDLYEDKPAAKPKEEKPVEQVMVPEPADAIDGDGISEGGKGNGDQGEVPAASKGEEHRYRSIDVSLGEYRCLPHQNLHICGFFFIITNDHEGLSSSQRAELKRCLVSVACNRCSVAARGSVNQSVGVESISKNKQTNVMKNHTFKVCGKTFASYKGQRIWRQCGGNAKHPLFVGMRTSCRLLPQSGPRPGHPKDHPTKTLGYSAQIPSVFHFLTQITFVVEEIGWGKSRFAKAREKSSAGNSLLFLRLVFLVVFY